jgi:hypothetical protein
VFTYTERARERERERERERVGELYNFRKRKGFLYLLTSLGQAKGQVPKWNNTGL